MNNQFSLAVHASTAVFDTLEPILTQNGLKCERVKPIQFAVDPPDTTVLIVTGLVIDALVDCFRIYMRESKKKITLVKGNEFIHVENCTDEQIEKVLSGDPVIYIEESTEKPSRKQLE